MKKETLFSFLLLLTAAKLQAQTNTFPSSGNVGIGTTSPQAALELSGSNPLLYLNTNNGNDFRLGSSIEQSGQTGIIKWSLPMGGYKPATGLSFYTWNDFNPIYIGGSQVVLQKESGATTDLLVTGNVGIGITTPTEKLSVNGIVRAKEIKVELQNWPDYVFNPSYKLPTLSETAQYIRENGHLPNMPTAIEVEKEGVRLGEMNKKLLEKVEELTLQVIMLSKQVEKQQEVLNRIKKGYR